MKISIVIPTLNEAHNLSVLIPYLRANSLKTSIAEIIISDGESEDNTHELFKEDKDIIFISGSRGRAQQMNRGAQIASGEIYYFLHADSFPPSGFDQKILGEIGLGHYAGCFRLKFDDAHPFLRISQWFSKWNFPICRGGDQSLFITKKQFEEMNGFNEAYTIYEDNEFTNRLYKKGNFIVIQDAILTSARKYHEIGVYRLQYHFAVIHLKKLLGASPEALYTYYTKHIR